MIDRSRTNPVSRHAIVKPANRLQALGSLLAAVGALAGCGGGGDTPVVVAPTPAPAPAPASATPLPDLLTLSVPPYVDAGTAVALSSNQGAGQAGLSYTWDLGNGTATEAAQVSPQTYAVGRYVVRLTVRNEAGATRSTSAQLLVGQQGATNVGLGCSKADGRAWCQQTANVTSVYFRTPSAGWATDDRGMVLKTIDGGLTWQSRSTGTAWAWQTVRFSDENRGWVLGWSEETIVPPCPNPTIITCASSAIARKPRLLRTVDAGATWTEQDLKLDTDQLVDKLIVIDANRAIAHNTTQSRVTADGGATWSIAQAPPASVTPAGRIWVVSSAGTLLVSDDLGKTMLREVTLGGRVDAVHFIDNLVGTAHVRPTATATASSHLIYRTTDGGDSWLPVSAQGLIDIAPAKYSGARIVTSDADVVWLTLGDSSANGFGYPAYITYRSTDGGRRWAQITRPAAIASAADLPMQPISAASAWIAGPTGMYLTRDAGLNWLRLAPQAGSPYDLQSASTNLFVGYADGTRGVNRWFRTGDDGTAWFASFDPPLRTAKAVRDTAQISHFFDLSHWMASAGYDLHETFDGGKNWALKIAEPAKDAYGNQNVARLQFTTPREGWLLVRNQLSHTTDGGVTWTPGSATGVTGPYSFQSDFDFRADGLGIQATAGGPFVQVSASEGRTAPGGVGLYVGGMWTKHAPLTIVPTSVRWSSSTVAVAVGVGGGVVRSTDAGQTWAEIASGVTSNLSRLTFVNAAQGWAVGDGGTVIRTSDAGLTWKSVTVATSVRLSDVVFVDALNGYIVGDTGTVLATHDGGATWTLQTTGTRQDIAAVYSPQPGVVRMVTRDGHVFASATGGY